MMKRSSLLVLAIALLLGGCMMGMPDSKYGEKGSRQNELPFEAAFYGHLTDKAGYLPASCGADRERSFMGLPAIASTTARIFVEPAPRGDGFRHS